MELWNQETSTCLKKQKVMGLIKDKIGGKIMKEIVVQDLRYIAISQMMIMLKKSKKHKEVRDLTENKIPRLQ